MSELSAGVTSPAARNVVGTASAVTRTPVPRQMGVSLNSGLCGACCWCSVVSGMSSEDVELVWMLALLLSFTKVSSFVGAPVL